MKGRYRVKNRRAAAAVRRRAQASFDQIGRVTFEHVRREFNKDADRLANEAMDEAAASTLARRLRLAEREQIVGADAAHQTTATTGLGGGKNGIAVIRISIGVQHHVLEPERAKRRRMVAGNLGLVRLGRRSPAGRSVQTR